MILWHILQHLNKHSNVVGTVEWRYEGGNERVPVIILTPPVASSSTKKKKRRKHDNDKALPKKSKFQVSITLKLGSSEWIPSSRLFPNRANLKLEAHKAACGTPVYNCDLVRDCMDTTSEIFHDLPQSLMDALILLKIWSLQRGFLGGHDAFTTKEEILQLLVYLLRTKHVTSRMAPLEIMAAWFKFVSDCNWLNNNDTNNNMNKQSTTTRKRVALVIPLEDLTESQTIHQCRHARLYAQQARDSPISSSGKDPPTLLDCYKQCTDGPILLNSNMTCNLWGTMSPSFVQQLVHAAGASLKCLHNGTVVRPFSYLFLQEARFLSSMDAVLRIPLSAFCRDKNNNTDLTAFDDIARSVVQFLEKALGDRVKLIRVLTTGNGRIETCDHPSQIPIHGVSVEEKQHKSKNAIVSPMGDDDLVVGFTINPETCHRLVDRGPPAEDVNATREFVKLWGSQKAQLRRFKDGAIVHAVVWNTAETDAAKNSCIRMECDDKSQGGIVERIVRHVLDLHFLQSDSDKKKHASAPKPQFALRDMLSLVDGVASPSSSPDDNLLTNATTAFKSAMTAFGSLSDFLRQNSSPTIPVPGSTDAKTSRLGVPLAIDAVEPLSPALRYSELFPPVPHQSLGGTRRGGKKVAGVAPPPILIQIRFGSSSKWPSDLKAMGAAKTAMLIQLADGIETMKHSSGFDGPIVVTPSYMDLGYKGYAWRIIVRADPELNMLRKLHRPSPEAVSLLKVSVLDSTCVLEMKDAYARHSILTRGLRLLLFSFLLENMLFQPCITQ